MKIAYLLKKFPRLSETFVLGEILGQEALGTDVVVFARRTADDEPRHAALSRLRAPIHLVGEGGLNPWGELFAESAAGQMTFERLGGAVRPLLADAVPRVSKLVAEALWVLRRSQELGVDHIHVHFATESAIVAWIVAQLGGPTYSLTAHAKDIYRSTVQPSMVRRLVGDSQFTVTVCDANVAFLVERIGPGAATQLRRLYNGIDLSDFRWSEAPREPATILAVGRLVKKKGFDVLLEALALMKAQGVALRARVLGDGEESAALVAKRNQLGLRADVEFEGAVDQDTVRAAMNSATVFALPCRIGEDGNRDALPTVLLEALATGLPVVSTRVTGIPEILDDGRCGKLIDADDPVALASALGSLLREPEERSTLARAGRERATSLFDGTRAAKTLGGWFEATRCVESVH